MADKTLRDLMTNDPVTLDVGSSAADAANNMRDKNVGNVLVTDKGELCGIVTDRDLVIRCIADGQNPKTTRLSDLCSKTPLTLTQDSSVGDAVKLMAEKAVRRVPVVEGKKPIGIVSLGDLALAQDRKSALGEISAARPQR